MNDIKNRITVVETVYHQVMGDQPDCLESRFTREVESQEQPYRRNCKVGEEWQALDTGWLDEVSMLVIRNEEGTNLQVHPTEEQKADLAKKVLLLSSTDSSTNWLILPGESFRGVPSTVKNLEVRSQSGTIRFILYATPR